MSAKTKTSTKVSARVAAVTKVFGTDQVDPENIHYTNWLYERRRCAVVRNGGVRQLRYEVEQLALEKAISKMISAALGRIRQRDGQRFAKEVADDLVERFPEAVSAAMKRRARRPDNRPAAH
jgi:hypothetical protein